MDFLIRINNAVGVGIHNDNTESKRLKNGRRKVTCTVFHWMDGSHLAKKKS